MKLKKKSVVYMADDILFSRLASICKGSNIYNTAQGSIDDELRSVTLNNYVVRDPQSSINEYMIKINKILHGMTS
jgi:hypothetical protein